jgi:hypothetical protein
MRLEPGTSIGAFEILAAIGAGGMGEVYRARDTRLGRDVALKILPESVAADADRLARFRREAHLLAALNHPRIAAIYGLEESNGRVALALELVAGDDLASRIARGRIPPEEAIGLARQIAEGLEAAHERGIVHRDLKPANIRVTPDGAVKLLDFGLAKAHEANTTAAANDISDSPTLTRHATEAGMILGTAAYMAPEQARGRPIDKRADIWAFGVVLYEMLAGRRLFDGDTTSDVLAAILTQEVDFSALPADTPSAVGALLRRCLERDATKRLRDSGEARIALSAPSDALSVRSSVAPSRRGLRWTAIAGAASVVAIAAIATQLARRPSTAAPIPFMTLGVDAGAAATLAGVGWAGLNWIGPTTVVSPDGSRVIFIARGANGGRWQLHVRRLDELKATALPSTDGAFAPFFSPDGRTVGFFARGQLMKVALDDGVVTQICAAEEGRGGTWLEDGSIVFAPRPEGPLFRVATAGGTATPATTLDAKAGEITHRWPAALPGGRGVLFAAHTESNASRAGAIVAWRLSDGQRTVVQGTGLSPRYASSGHLLYVHDGRLFAAPFDADALRVTGTAVPVVSDIQHVVLNGGAQYSVSDTGVLTYRRSSGANRLLHWMDLAGQTRPLRSVPADYREVRLSKDGARLLLVIGEGTQSDVWTYDIARDTMTRLTFHLDNDWSPIWSPDERHFVYASWRADVGAFNLYLHRTDGSGEPVRLTTSKRRQMPIDWQKDGHGVLFTEAREDSGTDLVLLPLTAAADGVLTPGEPRTVVGTASNELAGKFSPDGRWIAYMSDESGRSEVYVQPFPGPGGRWQISTEGGAEWIEWRTNTQVLYGRSEDVVMKVPYRVTGDSIVADRPSVWMRIPQGVAWTDPAPDLTRAAVIRSEDVRVESFVLVVNFLERLRQQVR